MPKFKIEFIFEQSTDKEIHSREVELPLGNDEFRTALLDLEEELYLEHDKKLVEVTTIAATSDISTPSINPNTSSIKQGDIVWCSWDAVSPDSFDKDRLNSLIDDYRPLWEAGPGYGELLHLLRR